MRGISRRTVLAAASTCVVLASMTLAYGYVVPDPPQTTVEVAAVPPLAISTHTTTNGLYPGKVATTQLAVQNTGSTAVKVTEIAAATSPAQSGCIAGVVVSDPRDDATGLVQVDGSSTVIAPGASANYAVVVRMSSTTPIGCAGKTFQLPVHVQGADA